MGNNCCNSAEPIQVVEADASKGSPDYSSYVVDSRVKQETPFQDQMSQENEAPRYYQEPLPEVEPISQPYVLEPPAEPPMEASPLEPPQPPRQQEEPSPSGPSLTLEFAAGGETKTVEIREQPLGLQFANRMPLTVSQARPNCSGAKAGVQDGWIFVKIGATPMEGLSYDAAVQLLKTAVQPLPKASGSFLLEFLTPSGTKTVNFITRPLDLTFDNQKMPVRVKKLVPGGQAEKLGVQVGWQISKGNGKDLCNIDFKTFMDVVRESTKDLPEAYFVQGQVQG